MSGGRATHTPDPARLERAKNPVVVTGQNYLAANVSQFFDLRGPSVVIDTACSSSLVAMDMAVQALRTGDTEAAVVAGVSLLADDRAHQVFGRRGLLNRGAEFHVFDRRAAGLVLAEGLGVVVSNPLARGMFPGQGSQYYRMGQELFDTDPVFGAALRRHDAPVVEDLRESVLARVFDPVRRKNEPFTETGITHPAIVMIELALAKTLQAAGIQPDYLLGASLGEYTAAAVSGSLAPAHCLRLLLRQAGALRAGPRDGMLAALAGPEVIDRIPALRACDIAARDYPDHFVVAGTEKDLVHAESALRPPRLCTSACRSSTVTTPA
ncbi:beta-ketoacyl synthase N-terminal-like domain-containing protein [Streptomyces sp. NPDC006314]|uniref:beta-ketoacyl synthase N-terminal-like domain-containing protein n=1 Tax=Streptomyces sp. NPDC006314 TaxID=3154475 RepID=UPI00339E2787